MFLLCATAALATFGVIAGLVSTGWLAPWDRTLFGAIYSGESDWPLGETTGRSSPVLQELLPWCYRAADDRKLLLLVAVVLILLVSWRWTRAALFFAGSVAVVAFAGLLKDLFGRPSPFPLPDDPSFPSGHAILSVAIAAAAVAIAAGTRASWLVTTAGLALVVGVALAAVADGGHWPSDVLGGWVVALAWVFAVRAALPGPLRGAILTSRANEGGRPSSETSRYAGTDRPEHERFVHESRRSA